MVIANNTVSNTHMMMTNKKQRKTSQGRKKIEIKKIEQETSRQVTFSKRRNGLFNKASELCVLTGAQIAVVVQSPGGRKFFTFGHPNVDLLIDRYLNKDLSLLPDVETLNMYNQFNRENERICKELEAEKKKMSEIDCRESSSSSTGGMLWWEEFEPFDDRVGLEEVEEYMGALQELKRKVLLRADDLMSINSSSSSFLSTNINLVQYDQMMMMNQTPKIHVARLDEHELMMSNSSSPISFTNLLQDHETMNRKEKHVGMEEQQMMVNYSSSNPLHDHEMMNQTENYIVGMDGCNYTENYDLNTEFDFSDGILPVVGSVSSFWTTNLNLVQDEMSMNQTAKVHAGMEEQLMIANSSLSILWTNLWQDEMNQKGKHVWVDDCNIENYDENISFDFCDGMVLPVVGSDFEQDPLFGLSSTNFWEGVDEELCFI